MKKIFVLFLLFVASTASAQPYRWDAWFPQYSILMGNTNNPVLYVAPSDSLKFLQCMGTNTAPQWVTAGVIATPVSIANGGTNASSASAARTSLAITGANLPDSVPVAHGGTGIKTATANGIIYGAGASNMAVTAAGTDAQILRGNTGSAPTWTTLNSLLIVLSDTTGQTGKKLTVKAGGGFDWE